jgi:hypothetical protein
MCRRSALNFGGSFLNLGSPALNPGSSISCSGGSTLNFRGSSSIFGSSTPDLKGSTSCFEGSTSYPGGSSLNLGSSTSYFKCSTSCFGATIIIYWFNNGSQFFVKTAVKQGFVGRISKDADFFIAILFFRIHYLKTSSPKIFKHLSKISYNSM